MERLRTIRVEIEVDTNKATYRRVLQLDEHETDETLAEFAERVARVLAEPVPE